MVIIPKSEVAEQAALDLHKKIHYANAKISFFEKKYKCVFKEFEKKIKKSSAEIFDQEDDYIAWKAYTKTIEYLQSNLKEIKRGNFKVA